MTPKLAHLYNRKILIERYPLKGASIKRRRPKSSPEGIRKKLEWSPLTAYVQSRNPIEVHDGGRTSAANLGLSLVTEKTSPSWSLGIRLRDPSDKEVRPGPCQYDIASALDKRSQAHNNPRFTIGVKTPGYLDKPPQSGSESNIGVPHEEWDATGKRGFTLGVRHKHLDMKPNPDAGPATYNIGDPTADSPEKLASIREHGKKYPNLGIKLKTRREIDAAIGAVEPPGPGQYKIESSVFGTRATTFGVRHKHLDPKYGETPGAAVYDIVNSFERTQLRHTPAYRFASHEYGKQKGGSTAKGRGLPY